MHRRTMDYSTSIVTIFLFGLATDVFCNYTGNFARTSQGSSRNNAEPSPKNASGTRQDFFQRLWKKLDARIRPYNEDGSPIRVQCGVYIMSFDSIDEVSMDYKVTLFLREIWTDERLAYAEGPQTVSLSHQATKVIWIPDIYFPNEKSAKFHDVTVPNSLVKIYSNGTVVYSVRLTLLLSCYMDLTSFPMDTQTCSMKLESYTLDVDQLVLEWMSDAVELDDELELPQFDIDRVVTHNKCQKSYKTTGVFPCLKAEFILHRQFGFFMLQTYIPSILIVILSWISFWISADAVPARISLGVTTVLTMTTQLSSSATGIPKVSYPKAIDVWLSVCMLFVFAALIEYAFVNSVSRKLNKDRRAQQHRKGAPDSKLKLIHDVANKTSEESTTTCGLSTLVCGDKTARAIDKWSRVVFPLTFLAFNVIYWPVYTQISH